MPFIRKGYGFHVGQDFARASVDTPITLEPKEYAKPGHVIGFIAGDKTSTLGFLRTPSVRVHVQKRFVADGDA